MIDSGGASSVSMSSSLRSTNPARLGKESGKSSKNFGIVNHSALSPNGDLEKENSKYDLFHFLRDRQQYISPRLPPRWWVQFPLEGSDRLHHPALLAVL